MNHGSEALCAMQHSVYHWYFLLRLFLKTDFQGNMTRWIETFSGMLKKIITNSG